MRQVLPVIGAVVGAYIGSFTGNTAQGAQIGWAIGSAVGNAVDPQVIKGPSIGDLGQQTGQEGVPRPIVFGLSQPMSGNIVYCSTPKIVTKKQRQGKGGPVTETQSVYRTYAIGMCEGPITELVRAWNNGRLVYDVRPGHEIDNNSKFLNITRIFLGDYDQLPSSDIEALVGSENTPAMRGTAYIVRVNEDLTSAAGAVPQFVFQVMRCEGRIVTSRPYPLLFEDKFSVKKVVPNSGQLKKVVESFDAGEDIFAAVPIPKGGSLTLPLESISIEDSGEVAVVPSGGTLKEPVEFIQIDDTFTASVSPTGGTLETAVVSYDNADDTFTASVSPTGGTLE